MRFGEGDVIGCYLDLNSYQVAFTSHRRLLMNFELDQHQAIMRFSVNGSDQGVAFRVAKSELAGRALFPHVLTKNQVIVPFAGPIVPFAGPIVLFQLGIQEFSPICSSITGWVWRKPTIMTHENFNFTISSGLHCELWPNAWSPLPA